MTNIQPIQIEDDLTSIEQQERRDERRAAQREAEQTDSIVNALTSAATCSTRGAS